MAYMFNYILPKSCFFHYHSFIVTSKSGNMTSPAWVFHFNSVHLELAYKPYSQLVYQYVKKFFFFWNFDWDCIEWTVWLGRNMFTTWNLSTHKHEIAPNAQDFLWLISAVFCSFLYTSDWHTLLNSSTKDLIFVLFQVRVAHFWYI